MEGKREPNENDQRQQKLTETQGPCPDLKRTCIKALNYIDVDAGPSRPQRVPRFSAKVAREDTCTLTKRDTDTTKHLACPRQASIPGGCQDSKIQRCTVCAAVFRKLRYTCLTFRLIFYCFVRGPRFRAIGVDSGPREGAFEGVLDPRK